jgi:RNA polymerase sigma-70 factor (ECF subfamily)
MKDKTEPFIPTRASLLNRLKDWDDKESWKDFFDTYWKLIYRVALKAGLADPEAQDVVQETVITVARKIKLFKYDPRQGSFKNWLLLITRRRILDRLRKHYRQAAVISASGSPSETGRTAAIEKIPDPASLNVDQAWEEEWQRNLVAAAIERIKRKTSPQQYQIFDLCVLKIWPVSKVARTLGINVARVYLAKHRITRQIKQEVEALEHKIF